MVPHQPKFSFQDTVAAFYVCLTSTFQSMTETSMAVASAVIVPESSEQPHSPLESAKRRKSPISEQSPKRARLGHGESSHGQGPMSPPPARVDNALERRKSGQMEERKRGQRLFGALLGTLSQSSSSTAQKRRTDIERKQQAKLKLQADEFDEKKKQRLDAIMEVRRREQKKYDKQSLQIRHSNLLAQAHFLQTKAEPRIYYKPWELLPGDDERIKAQIEEAEQLITRENSQHDVGNPSTDPFAPEIKNEDHAKLTGSESKPSVTVGPIPREDESAASQPDVRDTNKQSPMETEPILETKTDVPPETAKEQGDDGGEMVEGEEDTVIY